MLQFVEMVSNIYLGMSDFEEGNVLINESALNHFVDVNKMADRICRKCWEKQGRGKRKNKAANNYNLYEE